MGKAGVSHQEVHGLVEGVAELVRQASERYGLTLNAPLTLPAQVMGDRLRLNQLLDYLLSALSQLDVDSKPVLRWQAEVLSVGRQRLQLQLLLPPALKTNTIGVGLTSVPPPPLSSIPTSSVAAADLFQLEVQPLPSILLLGNCCCQRHCPMS